MKPTDAHMGRVFLWEHRGYGGTYQTVFVTLGNWSPNPDARLRIVVLETTYPYHSVGALMELRSNDAMWKEAKRIA